MNSLNLSNNKTLKLNNVLILDVDPDELENFQLAVQNMENVIKVKGCQPVGPLIQYTRPYVNDEGEMVMEIKLMRQSNTYINHIEDGYSMKPVIKVGGCMYCRYTGPEDKLRYAYDKISVAAFEENINLLGSSYTIFVDSNEEEEYIVADVFMEREQ